MDQLDTAIVHPVTLVCAPAGWGKTMLATSWIQAGRPTGRVAYLRFEANCGPIAWRQLTDMLAGAGLRIDPATYAWTNAEPTERAVVVLDDLHHVTNRAVLRRIERLITHLGDRVSFVLLARTEPPLSLYRWRVRGQLIELRTDHLAFRQDEVAALAAGHGVVLPQHFRYALWQITEGWPAALAVILATMVGRHEPERVITNLIRGELGPNADVGLTEYVRREVLHDLDPELRSIMLRTSILETVCPGVIEALTGYRDGARVLAQLSRANALATFCGGSHSWYRYRRLLRSLLRSELRTTAPLEEANLHRAASGWYAANGLPSDALSHAVAGGDWTSAERIFFQYWPELTGSGPRAMAPRRGPHPPEDIAHRPLLALGLAICCRDTGDLAGMSAFIRLGERGVRSAAQAEILAATRLAEAVAAEDYQRAAGMAVRVLACVEQAVDEHLYADSTDAARAVAYLTLAGSSLAGGDIDAAEAALEQGMELARQSGFNLLTVLANRQQALAQLWRGRLSAAAASARRVIDGARDAGIVEARNVASARLVLAEVNLERGQLDEARFHLEESINTNTAEDSTGWASGSVALARLLLAQGHHAGAAEALESLHDRLSPVVENATRVVRAELFLSSGHLGKARAVLSNPDLPHSQTPAMLLVLARIDIADGHPAAAVQAAERVLATRALAPQTGVAATVLLAQALRQLGDVTGAVEQIERAVRLAGPEGIRRPFHGHAGWMNELLTHASPALNSSPTLNHGPAANGGSALGSGPARDAPGIHPVPVGSTWAGPAVGNQLLDTLTERETLVLQYLRSMLSIAEIASVLSVSSNTVKTHVRHVYRKLGVSRRRDAVRRARELSLL